MSVAVKDAAAAFLTAALRALQGDARAAASPAQASALTSGHLSALATLLKGLPIEDLAAILQGHANIDTVLNVVERAAEAVRIAFAPAALGAAEVELALKALQVILDAAGLGSDRVTPGQNALRGGWSGARGHIL